VSMKARGAESGTCVVHKVASTLGVEDFSQLKKNYQKDMADVIMNITGNIISGQVTGETAKQLSERFGKLCRIDQVFLSTELILQLVGQNNWNPQFRLLQLHLFLPANL
jgi:hypothetical protein